MKPIATDISTFSELIEFGYVYVDKTAYLAQLVSRQLGKMFFMARPRRFGKSLTISTLQAIFEGRRELFKGLAIDSVDYDWQKYPVIRLDMSTAQAETVELFREQVLMNLRLTARNLHVSLRESNSIPAVFQALISDVAATSPDGQVVLLIDEYDKPLLGHLGRPTVEAFRSELKAFYSVIKAEGESLRFAFMTGVSKFSKVSIFSDLNNLVDITMDARFATLCGYTHAELKANFSEHVAALAAKNGLEPDAAFGKILAMYDGYRFEESSPQVVNPVSLGRCLCQLKFGFYWFETGTPTFLLNMLKETPLDLSHLEVFEDELGTYEPSNPAIVPLLFQAGYMTIKEFKAVGISRCYTLGFPNLEVESAFSRSLLGVYSESGADFLRVKSACWRALARHDVGTFFDELQPLFANIPYDLTDRQTEQTWQMLLYMIMRFLDFRVIAEERTNRGRIDLTVEFNGEIFILELKINRTAAEALAQIKEKGYAEKYRIPGKRVTLIGLNFSSAKRTIDDIIWE